MTDQPYPFKGMKPIEWTDEQPEPSMPTSEMAQTLNTIATSRGPVVTWKRIGDQHPPKHRRYAVIRGEKVFTCTVCYGMHTPWWIVHLLDGTEAKPVPMQDDDRWTDAILTAIAGEEKP